MKVNPKHKNQYLAEGKKESKKKKKKDKIKNINMGFLWDLELGEEQKFSAEAN